MTNDKAAAARAFLRIAKRCRQILGTEPPSGPFEEAFDDIFGVPLDGFRSQSGSPSADSSTSRSESPSE